MMNDHLAMSGCLQPQVVDTDRTPLTSRRLGIPRWRCSGSSEPCPDAAQQCGSRSGRTEYVTAWFVHGFLGVIFYNTVQNISIMRKSAAGPLKHLAQGVRIGASVLRSMASYVLLAAPRWEGAAPVLKFPQGNRVKSPTRRASGSDSFAQASATRAYAFCTARPGKLLHPAYPRFFFVCRPVRSAISPGKSVASYTKDAPHHFPTHRSQHPRQQVGTLR